MLAARWVVALCVGCMTFLTAAQAGAEEDRKGVEFFEKKIRPLFVQHCYECHSSKSKSVKGGLLVDTREGIRQGGESGAAVVPGDTEESLLIEAIKYEGLEMPPKGKLPEAAIADIVKWVKMGAPDPRAGKAPTVKKEINIEAGKQFWAFQPPKATQPPQVKNKAWPQTDLDRFVLAALEAKGIKPVGDADRRTWIRRASLDLTGLPPTVDEVDAFLSDKTSRAYEMVVDRLLASPQFGERWGRHWLDVARYAESTGKERNIPYPYAWRYRDWVIDAVNADKPYDRFLQEQVAGDLLPAEADDERNALLVATGFLALGPKGVNERVALQYTMDEVDEQIDVVGRAVLGTTISCARCHDHKFDPIPSSDYYALAGIFKSTQVYAGVTRGSRNWDQKSLLKLAGPEQPAEARPEAEPAPALEGKAGKQEKKVRQELKIAQEELAEIRTKVAEANKKEKKALQDLKKRYKELTERVTEIEARLAGNDAAAGEGADVAMAVREAKSPEDCRICIRGEVDDLGPAVPRGFVQVLLTSEAPKIDAKHSGRLQLAEWLTSRQNPLTARVMVNRIWQHLFGMGIVDTADNFGELGGRPSHPELLDHLAVKFMEQGWSVKRAIRDIVLSRTYQLSSQHNEQSYNVDPDNRLVWRATRRRLDAEVIRDSVLASSGQLDRDRPEGSLVLKLGNGEIGRNVKTNSLHQASNVRSIYLPLPRGVVPEMLSVFDVADPSLVVSQREVTTVATQALYMMNSSFMMEHSLRMAERVLADSSDDAVRADLAYQHALARPATDTERQRVLAFVSQYQDSLEAEGAKADEARRSAWSSVCQAIFASAEFRYVY